MTMDDQYPKLVVECQLARRRLAQAFEPGADSEIERQFLRVSDRTLATVGPRWRTHPSSADAQKNHYKEEASIGDPVQRSTMSFVHSRSGGTFARQHGTTKRDINGFSFILILILLSEITASQTDNPVFWLLVGPTPLALAFAANRLLRYRSTRSGSGKTISQE
jgi:hypothetical protein